MKNIVWHKTTINKKGVDMKGKFGRVLGDFMYKGKPVSKIMCREGFAVPLDISL
mgnify:CR=1 FL=1